MDGIQSDEIIQLCSMKNIKVYKIQQKCVEIHK